MPEDADALVFPASAVEFTSVNDLTDLIVQSIAIDDFRHQLSGNGIFLDQQLTASSAVAGTLSVSLPVTLLQPNMPFVVGADVELLMSGAITSAPGANPIKNGAGVLTLVESRELLGVRRGRRRRAAPRRRRRASGFGARSP